MGLFEDETAARRGARGAYDRRGRPVPALPLVCAAVDSARRTIGGAPYHQRLLHGVNSLWSRCRPEAALPLRAAAQACLPASPPPSSGGVAAGSGSIDGSFVLAFVAIGVSASPARGEWSPRGRRVLALTTKDRGSGADARGDRRSQRDAGDRHDRRSGCGGRAAGFIAVSSACFPRAFARRDALPIKELWFVRSTHHGAAPRDRWKAMPASRSLCHLVVATANSPGAANENGRIVVVLTARLVLAGSLRLFIFYIDPDLQGSRYRICRAAGDARQRFSGPWR